MQKRRKKFTKLIATECALQQVQILQRLLGVLYAGMRELRRSDYSVIANGHFLYYTDKQ